MGARPLDVLRALTLSRLNSHYFKYMRLAEQPAVFSALTLDPQQTPAKGFSQDAIQAICRSLSLLIWFPVPKGDLVRCSWIEIACDFISRFGTVPTFIEFLNSNRYARCINSIFKRNNVHYFIVKSLHLAWFGFGIVNRFHIQFKCPTSQGTLATLLSTCLHFEENAFGERNFFLSQL